MDEKAKSTGGKGRSGRSLQDLDAPAFRQQLIDPNSAVRKKAWEEVFAQLSGPSIGFLVKTKRVEYHIADEALQNAILKVMEMWPPKHAVDSFAAWFKTIVFREFVNLIRKPENRASYADFEVESETLRSRDPLPDEQLMWEEEGAIVLSAHERIREEKPAYARVVEEMVNGKNPEDYLSLREVTIAPDGKPRSPGATRTLIWTIRAKYREYMAIESNTRRRDRHGRGYNDVR